MKYGLLKTEPSDEGTIFLGLTELHHKASGVVPLWIDIREAKVNKKNSTGEGNLLLFDEKEQLEEDLELWGLAGENVAIIGVQIG
ncbi:hypothetical protein QUA70_12340 [Microcoleus sp. LAD1_D5]|uniref:hypothetical protein n=1 Tax=unclassified Microcoleus TaxID=2642155 RepID=UPI002FD6BA50